MRHSRISPLFYTRAGALIISPPAVQYDVDRYTRHAIGGPRTASIDCYGSEEALWQLGTLVRSPVELYDDNADLCWYGYVHAVRIGVGAVEWGLSLDNFANRVAVAYTTASGAASTTTERKTTAWASDAQSILDYGTKDFLLPSNNQTDLAAVAERNTELAIRKDLIPTIETGDPSDLKATLLLRGWWDTLSWRVFSRAITPAWTAYQFEPEDATADVGNVSQPYAAQGFIVTGTARMVVTKIRLKVVKIGTPIDDLIVDIYTGNANAPGTLVGSATLSAAAIDTTHEWRDWTTWTLEPVILTGVQYNLRVRRSGALNGANYFRVAANFALGYASGVMRVWDGAAWIVLPLGDADMLFEVFAEETEETTTQMSTMINAAGQFFSGAIIETASGLYTIPARTGDMSTLLEIEKLLNTGTASGLRFLAEVTRDRYLRIYTEPSNALPYTLDRNMVLRGSFGDPLPVHLCPAGIWTRLSEPMPGAAAGAGLSFVEEAEYSARTGVWKPVSRRTKNPMRGNKWA